MGVDRADFSGAANWQIPQELPDLRRVGIVALDTETRDAGLQADRGSSWPWRDGHVCGISAAWREGGEIRSLYIPMGHPDSDNFDPAQVYGWLTDLIASGVRIVTQNGIYDWGWLRADGGIVMPPADRLEEVGALASAIDENQFSCNLDALCDRYDLPGKDETLLKQAVEAAGFASKNGKCRRGTSAPTPKPMRRAHSRSLRSSTRFWIENGRAKPIALKSLCCRRCWRDFRLRRLALRRGSGQGRSVHVCWCGGPSETEVEAVAEKHAHRGLSLLLLRDEAVHPLRQTDTSARWPRDLRPLCAGTVGMRRHGARAMSARRRAPTLYAVAAEELERAGDDRAKAVTALTHRLLADETLRQALVEPIIRNIAAGSIATVVHHRRGAE